MQKYFKQRFLICQPILGDLNGSTMVTLELCEYLIRSGAEVTVFSYYIENPAKELFDKAKVKLIDYKDNLRIKANQYDFVWIHSQTIPPCIVEDLGNDKQIKTKFIFLHMAAVDYIPDERPYIYQLEQKISSKTLFISEEVKEKNIPFFTQKLDYAFFRNPAPKEFIFDYKKQATLNKILIVSNHPPKELLDARKILASNGIEVELIGEGQKGYRRITPAVIKKYNAIITIGKTVQYCFMSGTPVYVYDMHGGPGWLSEKNFSKAKENNFSGRGFCKKTPNQIAQEIMSGYHEAQNFYDDKMEQFRSEYLIDNVLDSILSDVKTRKISPFAKDYILAIKESLALTSIRFNLNTTVRKLKEENEQLRKNIEAKNNDIKEITSARAYRIMKKTMNILHRQK